MKETNTPRPLWISIISIMLAFLLVISAAGGPQLISMSYAKYAASVPVGNLTLSIDAAPAILTTGPILNELFKANSTAVTSVTFGSKSQYASYCTGTGIDVSATGDGSLKLYRSGSNIYIVSENDRVIASNPDFSNAFSGLTSLKTVKFPDDFDTSRTTSFAYFCYGASALESINVGMFDTSNATTMQSMFYLSYNSTVNQKLSVLDVSGFDTSKVTDMGSIFRGCGNITSFDLSNFDTSNVKDMGGMFDGCDSLTSVNVSSFDTSKATTMQVMFNGCTSLKTLDLSSFTCESLTDIRSMFAGCSNLKTIYADYEFDCRNVASSGGAFTGCNSLVGGYGTSYNTNAASTDAEIKANAATGAYAVIDLKLSQEQDVLQSTQGYFTHSSISGSETTSVLTTGSSFNSTFKSVAGSTTITKIVFGKSSDYSSLTGGTNVDAAGTGKIKMIKSGSTIYVLSNATICFNPASDYMFQNLSTVQTIIFDNIDTGAVRTMQRMFEGCTALKAPDLSSFDTKNVLDFGGFFRYCDGLTSADAKAIAEATDTSKGRDLGGFFSGCDGLSGALDLSAIESNKAETIASFISDCPNITSVNFSGLTKTSALYNASNMFSNCKSLKTIYTSESFNLTGLPTTSPATGSSINGSIFDGCTSLVGGNGTKFTTAQVGRGYARPDASGSPGYFTAINIPASLSLFALAPMMLTNPDVEPELSTVVSNSDAPAVSASDIPADTTVSGSDISTTAPVVSATDVTTTTTTVTTTTAATSISSTATTITTTATTAATTTVPTTAATTAAEAPVVSTTDVTTTASTSTTAAASVSVTTTTSTAADTTASTEAMTTTASSETTTSVQSSTAAAATVSSAETTAVSTTVAAATTTSTASTATEATAATTTTASTTTTAAVTTTTTTTTTTTATTAATTTTTASAVTTTTNQPE